MLPGGRGNMSGGLGMLPGGLGMLPGGLSRGLGMLPGGRGNMSRGLGMLPGGLGMLPGGRRNMSGGLGMLPVVRGKMSGGLGMLPVVRGKMSRGLGMLPVVRGKMPGGLGMLPPRGDKLPRRRGTRSRPLGRLRATGRKRWKRRGKMAGARGKLRRAAHIIRERRVGALRGSPGLPGASGKVEGAKAQGWELMVRPSSRVTAISSMATDTGPVGGGGVLGDGLGVGEARVISTAANGDEDGHGPEGGRAGPEEAAGLVGDDADLGRAELGVNDLEAVDQEAAMEAAAGDGEVGGGEWGGSEQRDGREDGGGDALEGEGEVEEAEVIEELVGSHASSGAPNVTSWEACPGTWPGWIGAGRRGWSTILPRTRDMSTWSSRGREWPAPPERHEFPAAPPTIASWQIE